MKFFLDTANLDELRKGAARGIVDGVATNPSLIAKGLAQFLKDWSNAFQEAPAAR